MNDQPSCRVYLFRHGETANSNEVCFNGHFDVGLSVQGENQFREWAQVLKDEPFKAIYSSDLDRTQSSARLLGEPHQLEPVTYPELRELCFGDCRFEGIVAQHPNEQIAVVCHGGVNRVIFAHLLEIPMKRIFRVKQDYAALNIIQYYGDEPVVELLGGVADNVLTTPTQDKKIAIQ